MKQKRIDIIVKYFFPVTAGIEVNIAETYSRLVKKGWKVVLHTSRDTYLEKDVLKHEELIKGILIKRYSFKWYGFIPNIPYRSTDLVALHNFDIFPHAHLLAKVALDKFMGKKNYALALTPHGGFNPEWSLFSFSQKFIKKAYQTYIGRPLINYSVDAIRAVSEWEREALVQSGIHADKVLTISNGLEDEAFINSDRKASNNIKRLTKSYGKYIFGNARIYEIKNQETIIRALPLIPANIKFVNIGTIGSTVGNELANDNYLKKLKKLALELNVSDRVIFPGIVSGIDKYYLFKHAQAFVHMAIWESFCNVVHEAISQGQVCVVSNNTALPYLVKDKVNGFLVNTFDHKQLADKINFALDPKNKKEIKRIRDNNLRNGRENSWRQVSLKMESLYNKIIYLYAN